jgi:hypothetical protein
MRSFLKDHFSSEEIFTYTVPKFVKIRDTRLGFLQFGFNVTIFVYVVLYSFFYRTGTGSTLTSQNDDALSCLFYRLPGAQATIGHSAA